MLKMAAMSTGDSDDGLDVMMDLADICADPPKMRNKCKRCNRPEKVCWCPYLPSSPLNTTTKVYILQHPFEESRPLQTSPMLFHGLPPGHCQILKGKRFNCTKNPELSDIIDDPNTFLLYPGPKARELADVAAERKEAQVGPCNLVLLDGTWAQARGIYTQNRFLHSLQQVQLSHTGLSEYVIRTQPMDGCLSTLETAAISIAILEHKPELSDALIEPLRALCSFQLNYGAVEHQSKQYLLEHGLYIKQKPKQAKDKTKHVGQIEKREEHS